LSARFSRRRTTAWVDWQNTRQ